ncbi:hypothetical protein ACDN41_12040 [Priestia aryabhattai]|uniref:hypothetical protein n=1 Tax=Priestia aryabhattai TaxID=412384 RepID=UPI0035326FB4
MITIQELRKLDSILVPTDHKAICVYIWFQPLSESNLNQDYIYNRDDVLYDDIRSIREFLERYDLKYVYLTHDDVYRGNKTFIDFNNEDDIKFNEYINKLKMVEDLKRKYIKLEEFQKEKQHKEVTQKQRVYSINTYTLFTEHSNVWVKNGDQIIKLHLYAEESEDDGYLGEHHIWTEDNPRTVEIEERDEDAVVDFFSKYGFIYFDEDYAKEGIYRYKVTG